MKKFIVSALVLSFFLFVGCGEGMRMVKRGGMKSKLYTKAKLKYGILIMKNRVK